MDQELECGLCYDVFNKVVETPCCSKLYCETCIISWLERNPTCPACRQNIQRSQLKPNIPFQRLVDNLPTTCPNTTSGCTSKLITRGGLLDHLPKCEFAMVDCPFDSSCKKIYQKDFKTHTTTECPFRLISCDCGKKISINQLDNHMSIDCPKAKVKCDLCTISGIAREDLSQHIDKDCPCTIIVCPYIKKISIIEDVDISKYECSKLKIERQNLSQHLATFSEDHLELFKVYSDETQFENKLLLKKIYELQKAVIDLKQGITSLSNLKPKLEHSPMYEYPVILPSKLVKNANVGEITIEETGNSSIVSCKIVGFFSVTTNVKSKPHMVRGDVIIPNLWTNPKKTTIASLSMPLPQKKSNFYYFEIKIENPGKTGAIGLGIAPTSHSLIGMPGWGEGSFGYHGDDGRKFNRETTGYGAEYGPKYSKGDIIGCGYDQDRGVIFFTKNGEWLGVAFENVPLIGFFPVVGLDTWNGKIVVNWGTDPFQWDMATAEKPLQVWDEKQEKKST